MKILFVTPMFPTSRNSQSGIFVWEFACAFQALGHDIRVVSIDSILHWPFSRMRQYRQRTVTKEVPTFAKHIAVRVRQFPRNFGMAHQCRAWSQIIKNAIDHEWADWIPDVVHSHTVFPGAALGFPLARGWQCAHIATSHGADTRVHLFRRATCRAIMTLVRQGLHIVCVGPSIRETFASFGVPTCQLTCIYNGMDLSKLQSASAELRQRYSGRKLVVGLGNLHRSKGFDFLLRAFAEAGDILSDWDLAIVGGGTDSARLNALCARLQLTSRVTFAGPVSRTEAMQWLDLCDIFCLPSWAEGFGIAYLEAMASGKPVIAVAGQGIADIVTQYQTGILVEPQSVQSLVDALTRLSLDEQMRDAMGHRGRRLARDEFSWLHCAKKYLSYYEDLPQPRVH